MAKNVELVRQIEKLRALIKSAQSATAGDIELQSHWAKYVCVLASGFLENSVEVLFGEYCDRTSSPQVANFAKNTLRRVQNPKASKFIEIARGFSDQWGDSLETFLSDDGRKEAIDAIMTNRHLIAHGKSSGISLARIKEYLSKSVDVVEYIEVLCK